MVLSVVDSIQSFSDITRLCDLANMLWWTMEPSPWPGLYWTHVVIKPAGYIRTSLWPYTYQTSEPQRLRAVQLSSRMSIQITQRSKILWKFNYTRRLLTVISATLDSGCKQWYAQMYQYGLFHVVKRKNILQSSIVPSSFLIIRHTCGCVWRNDYQTFGARLNDTRWQTMHAIRRT